MDPPRSRDTKSVISVARGLHEEVRLTRWWAPWCFVDILRNPVGDGSRPAGVCELHYVAGPPNFRRLGLERLGSSNIAEARNPGGLLSIA
ncbi:unnamed protein product [Heligmosomoides polygyrus]|uniref:GNAT family N-acetyltransferase n=1 Tax=Heligmosomoides polygyrus TaxID=6339 RepID=A0A183FT72_HELPZ|nr:unnamed protein product [Heligmosomoides polygyrus]